MLILPMGAPKRCAIFSARACEPVPAKILTEGFMVGKMCFKGIDIVHKFLAILLQIFNK
jgi:hypothetical protein